MSTIRVGIIGSGFIGGRHVDAIRRIPGAEVVALADTNESAGRNFCEHARISSFYGDYRRMLETENLDVVHNCTPNALHFPVCKDVIERGIAVYCEKPLALTSSETAELCRLATEHNVLAGVNFNYRQNAAVHAMRRCVADLTRPLGKPWGKTFLVRGHYLQDWMQYATDYNWRCIPELNGASRTVADVGSHWFDTVQFILGKRIVRVFADLVTAMPERLKASKATGTFQASTPAGEDGYERVPIESEDAAFVMVEFEDGTKGQLTVSQVTAGHKNDLKVAIDGSAYALEWEQERPDVLALRDRELGCVLRQLGTGELAGEDARFIELPAGHAVGWADALKNAISEFYAALLARKRGAATEPCGAAAVADARPLYATFEEADHVVRIVEACMKSSKEGRWVDVG